MRCRKPKARDQVGLHTAAKAAVVKPKLKKALVDNNGNITAAARDVGIGRAYAAKLMPDVRAELMHELDRAGADAGKVARVIGDAMDALKEGFADHATRLRAAQFHTRITGATAPHRSAVFHAHAGISEQLEPRTVQERVRLLQKFEDDLDSADDEKTA